jgi:pfkB family carbohydrate kinase
VTIALVGHTTVDTVTTLGGDVTVRPGGAPLYGQRALRAAGEEPVVITKGGELDGALLLPWRTPVRSVLLHRPDGLEQRLDDVGEPFTAAEVRHAMAPLLADCSFALLGAQSAGDFPPDTIAAVAEAGPRVCLDAQGLARGAQPGPVRLRAFPPEAVHGISILKLNRAEAEAAGDLDALAAVVEEILVTDGPRGATVIVGGERLPAPGSGHPFDDPTGAGDSFGAVYLLHRERGLDPHAAAVEAVALVERLYAH